MTFNHTNGTARRVEKPLTMKEIIDRYNGRMDSINKKWEYGLEIIRKAQEMRG